MTTLSIETRIACIISYILSPSHHAVNPSDGIVQELGHYVQVQLKYRGFNDVVFLPTQIIFFDKVVDEDLF